jgi:methionine sulfoxide reductase heme-binding subunit
VISAIELSSDIGLVAVGLLTTNILLGLLMSVGYNPMRRWPRRRVKLFTLHNWTGYTALAAAALHPIVVLFSSTAGFRPLDIAVPIWSPTQPVENTLGAIGLYFVAFAVLTSYFRHVFGFRRWKQLHYTTYAAAVVFFAHSLLTDPELKNRPVDWLDAEKVFVEACAVAVMAATAARFRARRAKPGVAARLTG